MAKNKLSKQTNGKAIAMGRLDVRIGINEDVESEILDPK